MADSKDVKSSSSTGAVAIVVPKITKTFTEAIDSMVLAKWPPAGTAPVPLKPHEVRIAVHAVSLNFFDLLGAVGRYQYKYEPPYVLGSEASGVITAVGAKVKGYAVGQAVCVGMSAGVFASVVTVPAAACLPKPAGWTHVQSAAVSVGFLTAYHGLVQRGGLQKGQTLLVTGATGGMGAAAVQLGVVVGATVIAGCSSADKCELATSKLGATHAIDYSSIENLKKRVNEITGGKGVDVVYEVVGGDVFDACTRVMNWNGKLLVVGFAAGRIPSVPANLPLVKSYSVVGVASGASIMREPKLGLDAARRLDDWTRSGALPPPYIHDIVPLPQFKRACTAISDRSVRGKIVIQFVDEQDRPTYSERDVKPIPSVAAAAAGAKLKSKL